MDHPQAGRNPPIKPPPGTLDRALALVEFLRANCPWDAAQTHASLRRYLLEEAHEVVDAIDGGDDGGLLDELGDLLLNVAFQVVIAEERGAFGREAVVDALEDKMRRRHPHLYGEGPALGWEAAKAKEKSTEGREVETGLLAGLIPGKDALGHAQRVQARVAEVGFDWADASGAWAKVREEVEEIDAELSGGTALRVEEEVGDLLFAVVNFARLSGIHAGTALARANAKFARRFAALESRARGRGIQLEEAGLERLDALWDEVKREES